MGEGQENVALNSLQDTATNGSWLTLKNIHLVTSWLPILTQTLSQLEIHEDFRYFFVITIYSSSIKKKNSF